MLEKTLSAPNLINWQDNAIFELRKDYQKIDNYFYTNGAYDYENDWSMGAAMCQQAIEKCLDIIQEVSKQLKFYPKDSEITQNLQVLDKQAKIFLHHFKDEKQCAKTSAWAIPLQYLTSYTLLLAAAPSVVSLTTGSLQQFYYKLMGERTLVAISSKVALVALGLTLGISTFNSMRLEKRKNHRTI